MLRSSFYHPVDELQPSERRYTAGRAVVRAADRGGRDVAAVHASAAAGAVRGSEPVTRPVHEVVVLVQPGVFTLDVASAAQLYVSDAPGSPGDAEVPGPTPPYRVHVSALEPGAIPTSESFDLHVPTGLDQLDSADTVVVAGGSQPVVTPPSIRDALVRASTRGARLVGLGTGVFALGAAGLLDGRSVTTHWRHADLLRVTYPRARVVAAIFVQDGEIFTSPGLAAAIDLHVELISRDHGVDAARRIAQAAVTGPVRAGDLRQVVDRPLPSDPESGLGHLRAWMIEHLHEPMTLDALAGRAFMSRRQFTRVFRAETGISPWQWLLSERLKEARRMLESTREPVEQIGFKCGFPTAASFRMHCRRATGLTPSAYRTAFGASRGVAAAS
jgi:AraC family transcriptional regulator, transcriptional activator FtrA